MTKAEKRAVLAAIARWDPAAPSVELTAADRQELREQIAVAVAGAIGAEPEDAVNRMDAIRMAG